MIVAEVVPYLNDSGAAIAGRTRSAAAAISGQEYDLR
jgi:hypothetical protein